MKNVQAGYRKQQALSDIASQLDQAKICSEVEDEARTDTITDHLSDERRAVLVVPFLTSMRNANGVVRLSMPSLHFRNVRVLVLQRAGKGSRPHFHLRMARL
jgi:hypothetical protein